MTRYLWTGKSEYCICGHHVTDHETSQWPIIMLTERPIVTCNGGNKARIIRRCHCDEFRPYRIVEEDEEVIENKIRMEMK